MKNWEIRFYKTPCLNVLAFASIHLSIFFFLCVLFCFLVQSNDWFNSVYERITWRTLLKVRLLGPTLKFVLLVLESGLRVWIYNNFLCQADAASLRLPFENCWFISSISPLYSHKWDQVKKKIQKEGKKEKERIQQSLNLTSNAGYRMLLCNKIELQIKRFMSFWIKI